MTILQPTTNNRAVNDFQGVDARTEQRSVERWASRQAEAQNTQVRRNRLKVLGATAATALALVTPQGEEAVGRVADGAQTVAGTVGHAAKEGFETIVGYNSGEDNQNQDTQHINSGASDTIVVEAQHSDISHRPQ